MKSNVYEKEYSLGDFIVDTTQQYMDNFKIIFMLLLVIVLPINIITFLLFGNASTPTVNFGFTNIIILFILSAISLVSMISIAYAIKQKIDKKSCDLKEAITFGFNKLMPALGTMILLFIFVFLLSLLLIIPGIIFAVYWTFALYVVIFKNVSGNSALSQSKELVQNRWWKTLGFLFIIGLIPTLIGFIAIMLLPPLSGTITIISSFISTVINAFAIVGTTLLFLNYDKNRLKVVRKRT